MFIRALAQLIVWAKALLFCLTIP